MGQAEREATLERQREGIARGEARRPLQGPCADRATAGCRGSPTEAEGIRPSDIALRLGIGRASVYRVLGAVTGGVGVGSRADTTRRVVTSFGSALERGSLMCVP